jgi:thiamine kinase-like enzyme
MPSLSKYITSSLICIFSFSLFAENIDYEELIQGVFQNSDQYPKRLLELGATNINYEVKKGGKSYFFRHSANLAKELYSSQDIEYLVLKQLEKTKFVPCPYFFDSKRGLMITEYIEHDEVTLDLQDQKVQEAICGMLKSIEEENIVVDRVFDPYQDTLVLAKKATTPLPQGLDGMLSALEKISKNLRENPRKTLCHLDLHHKNILQKGDRLFLIDWEYAAMSHPYHTFASMASIERWSDDDMWKILDNYMGNSSQEDKECMYLYRIVSDLFWAVWCHVQMENPSTNSPYTEWRDLFFAAAKERINELESVQGESRLC